MAKMKQFMKQQILEGRWVEAETCNGMFWIPGVLRATIGGTGIPACWDGKLISKNSDDKESFDALVQHYEIYIPASARDIISFEVKTGFGARLSAPSYLDSTDWCVFDTVEEALKYLEELRSDE